VLNEYRKLRGSNGHAGGDVTDNPEECGEVSHKRTLERDASEDCSEKRQRPTLDGDGLDNESSGWAATSGAHYDDSTSAPPQHGTHGLDATTRAAHLASGGDGADHVSPASFHSGGGGQDIGRLESALAALYDSMDPTSLQLTAALHPQSSESEQGSPRGFHPAPNGQHYPSAPPPPPMHDAYGYAVVDPLAHGYAHAYQHAPTAVPYGHGQYWPPGGAVGYSAEAGASWEPPRITPGHSSSGNSRDDADPNSREMTRKPWLAAEDETILESVQSMGARWRVIAQMLPGRSDDAVRNRWNRLQEVRAGECHRGRQPCSLAAAS
jgi:hypothetical protein